MVEVVPGWRDLNPVIWCHERHPLDPRLWAVFSQAVLEVTLPTMCSTIFVVTPMTPTGTSHSHSASIPSSDCPLLWRRCGEEVRGSIQPLGVGTLGHRPLT